MAFLKTVALSMQTDYAGKEIVAVGLLNGSFLFLADLMRNLTVPYKLDTVVASSYGDDTSTSGTVTLTKEMNINPRGKHILLLDGNNSQCARAFSAAVLYSSTDYHVLPCLCADLIDTGTTLKHVAKSILARNPASLRIAVLCNKKARRKVEVAVSYVGFEIPDEFVVGVCYIHVFFLVRILLFRSFSCSLLVFVFPFMFLAPCMYSTAWTSLYA